MLKVWDRPVTASLTSVDVTFQDEEGHWLSTNDSPFGDIILRHGFYTVTLCFPVEFQPLTVENGTTACLSLAASPSLDHFPTAKWQLVFPVIHKSTPCTKVSFSVPASGGAQTGWPSEACEEACSLTSTPCPASKGQVCAADHPIGSSKVTEPAPGAAATWLASLPRKTLR